MGAHVCPVWIGYLLASPVRKFFCNPERILESHVREGMTVIDVGCAMGFFSLPLASMVGDAGRVVAIDVQEGMLSRLKKRAARAEVGGRLEARLCEGADLGLGDLERQVDFALAFAMVHEADDPEGLIRQIHAALKEGGRLLIAEPKGHVSDGMFSDTLRWSSGAGFATVDRPPIGGSHSVLLERTRVA